MQFLLIFSFLILVMNSSDARNDSTEVNGITGVVIDLADNIPLIGVNVIIKELREGTVTDKTGSFKFYNVVNGSYTLQFSFMGHKTVDRAVTVPSEEALNIIIKLEEATINLNDIVITGNPFLSEVKELSQTAILVNKLDLMVRSGTTVADVLNFQPGISKRSNGIAAGRPVIRGFSNNKVLILEDGLRMGDLSGASDDHAISDDGNVTERIEVIAGPSSLLYGSNAIGGVVNIITDAIPSSIQKGLSGDIQMGGASVNSEYFGSAHLNFGIDKFSFHSKLFKRKGEDYKFGGGNKTPNSDLESKGLQAGFSIIPEWGTAGMSYTDFNSIYGLPVSPDAGEVVYIDMHKKQFKLYSSFSKINSFIRSVDIKAGYLDYKHNEISRLTGQVGTEFAMNTQSADISFLHKPILPNTSGVIGIYGLFQDYVVTGSEALTPNADYNNFAAYFLEKIELGKFNFSFGLRYEVNNIKFPQAVLTDSLFSDGNNIYKTFSASAGLIYNLNENISLFTNIANAFRAPTIEELSSFGIHEALASFDIGNRGLKKENSAGFDFGLRNQSDKFYFESAAYYSRIFNLIYRKPIDLYFSEEMNQASGESMGFNSERRGFKVFRYSQAEAVVYGFETKLNYEIIRGLSATFISDYVRAKNQSEVENLFQTPPFRFSFELRYTSHQYWYGLNWKLVSAQNKVAPNEAPTSGYGLVDIYSGMKVYSDRFAHIVSLKVENLFDQSYKDHLSAVKDFTNMPGRNIVIGYRFVF